ncbi:hypothetical protein ACNOYE_23960 [Nannocystaceae bacterium ST9]
MVRAAWPIVVATLGCTSARADAPEPDAPTPDAPTPDCSSRETLELAGRQVDRLSDQSVMFRAGMAIDADGSPHAYHPDDTGLDFLANAGEPGNWWALVVDGEGVPIVQTAADPAPGYHVSMTALEDRTRATTDPRRYVDAETIAFVVLPPALKKWSGAKLGDLALVVDPESGKRSLAMFADLGPRDRLGEGSIALAKALGIPDDPRRGGTTRALVWLVWPGSGDGKPHDAAWIGEQGEAALARWGGLARLERCLESESESE